MSLLLEGCAVMADSMVLDKPPCVGAGVEGNYHQHCMGKRHWALRVLLLYH